MYSRKRRTLAPTFLLYAIFILAQVEDSARVQRLLTATSEPIDDVAR